MYRPSGRLDAQPADAFCRRFLRGWVAGTSAETMLWHERRRGDSDYAARRLRLLGRGELRPATEPGLGDQPTATLAPAYLMRAYALWAWRADDQVAARWLASHLRAVERLSPSQDPGPLGLALGYLYFYQREHSETVLALPRWEIAAELLAQWQYWFELAMLGGMLGHEQADGHLKRFHEMRHKVVAVLENLPAWLTDGSGIEWRDVLKSRSELECSIIRQQSIDLAVRHGMVPL